MQVQEMELHERRLHYLNQAYKEFKNKVNLPKEQIKLLDDLSFNAANCFDPLHDYEKIELVLYEDRLLSIAYGYDLMEEIALIVDLWNIEEEQ